MTVSDPLLKELKGCTRNLIEHGKEIDDDYADLHLFCKCLEKCLQKGVLARLNVTGFPRLPDPWYWLEDVSDKNTSSMFTFASIVEQTKQNEKLHTSIGRLRLLIRTSLTRKCLHVPVEFLCTTANLASDFYQSESIIGDEILCQILLSVLLQISKLSFKLNLRNCSFLDETWALPRCVALELVPCKHLGLSICFIENKALVINVEKYSVAAEDDKVEIGDILDEINGTAITSKSRGKLHKIMREASGKPVSLHIVKLKQKQSNNLYGPLVNLIKSSDQERVKKLLENPKAKNQNEKKNGVCKSATNSVNSGISVRYSISTVV